MLTNLKTSQKALASSILQFYAFDILEIIFQMVPSTKVYLVYERRMVLHAPVHRTSLSMDDIYDRNDFEKEFEIPNRIRVIHDRLMELQPKIGRRFIDLPCPEAKRGTIELVHSASHYDFMARTEKMQDDELINISVPNDLYFCHHTFMATKLAVGGVVECVNAVTNASRQSTRAIAIVRPPGHHAGRAEAMGKSIVLISTHAFGLSISRLALL